MTPTPADMQPDTRRLLNSPCLVCDTKLTDPTSVTLGIGPTCRKNNGWADLEALSPGDNARAKALVYEAALKRDSDPKRVLDISTELLSMGLTKLAVKIQDRFIEVRLHMTEAPLVRWDRDRRCEVETGETAVVLQVKSPYHAGFRDALFASCRYRRSVYVADPEARNGRRFSHWEVKYEEARGLYKALATCYPGKAGIGPKGIFHVPSLAEFKANFSKPRLRPVDPDPEAAAEAAAS